MDKIKTCKNLHISSRLWKISSFAVDSEIRKNWDFCDASAWDGDPGEFAVAKVGRERKEFHDEFCDRCPMLLGYARVSTADQDLLPQRTALQAAGCARIYEEKAGSTHDQAISSLSI